MRNTPEEEAGNDPASSLPEETLERKFYLEAKSFDSGKVVAPVAGPRSARPS